MKTNLILSSPKELAKMGAIDFDEQLKQAIAYMSEARDVHHWNERRARIKNNISMKTLTHIDSSGLIIKVKNKNNWK